MGQTAKRINVTVTRYEADVDFPEAAHYDEFVAEQLAERYGAAVECSYGLRTQAFCYGFGDDEPSVTEEIVSALKVDLWEVFCADGYKAFTAE